MLDQFNFFVVGDKTDTILTTATDYLFDHIKPRFDTVRTLKKQKQKLNKNVQDSRIVLTYLLKYYKSSENVPSSTPQKCIF